MAKGINSLCLRCKAPMDIKGADNKAVCSKCGWERK